ncbi:DUF3857 domain-containing protein [Phenylobacterium sp.]|uniref:DUF3857 domain-containing protein n=1 Tax=Phenylobacterium sp. TaxID=1871053 RepID=UPI003D2E46B3
MSEVPWASAAARVGFEPAPEWALLPPIDTTLRPPPERSEEGRYHWLSDSQLQLSDDGQTWLSRSAFEVTSPAGLQGAGSLSQDFDPAFQKLSFHFVRIIRDGVAREIDVSASLEVLRRERDMERAMFDGRLTGHVSIPDVRVGDILDLCHSVRGQNPVLAGRFAAEWRFNWTCWVGETQVRLLAPDHRTFHIQSWNQAPECVVEQLPGGVIARTWRALATEPATLEPVAPSWARQLATVRVSDLMSWGDVANAFRGYYEAQPLPAELEEEVAAIKAQSDDPAVRAVLALRLVQGALRYQSVTIGDGGFVPRDIAAVWSSRAGDCKDSSRLLAALLGRLGLEATPALVNIYKGEVLGDEAPSLVSFDHCIVRLTLDGARYWLDPTSYPQGGRLAVVCQPRLGKALPLVADAELEDMGRDAVSDSLTTSEIYTLPILADGLGEITIDTIHHGWRADLMRRRLAGGIGVVTREFLAFYERRYGAVTAIAPLEVTDDLEGNSIRIVERYQAPQIWGVNSGRDYAVFETFDDAFSPFLPGLAGDQRRWPIDLGMPLRAKSTIEIRSPVAAPASEWDIAVAGPGISAASKFMAVDTAKGVLRLERSLVFEQPIVAPELVGKYAAFRDDVLRNSNVRVHHPVRAGRIVAAAASASESGGFWSVFWWIVGGLWVLGLLARVMSAGAAPS